MKAFLEADGCVVVNKALPEELVVAAREAVEAHTRLTLAAYGKSPDPEFRALLEVGKGWEKAPTDWTGPSFGLRQRRGWIKGLGSGQMFADFNPAAVAAVRAHLRGFIACLHGVPPSSLRAEPDKASIKCAGCPALPLHIDKNRLGSYQVVVALSSTSFVTVLGSHKQTYGGAKKGYYELSKKEAQELEIMSEEVTPGTVLVMEGGTCVHGSPAVKAGEPRIAMYVHYSVAKTDSVAAIVPAAAAGLRDQ